MQVELLFCGFESYYLTIAIYLNSFCLPLFFFFVKKIHNVFVGFFLIIVQKSHIFKKLFDYFYVLLVIIDPFLFRKGLESSAEVITDHVFSV